MADTMLAVRKVAKASGVELKEIPVPSPDKGELLIKVKAASICGTDISLYNWTPWAEGHIKDLPVTLGHEVVGEVIEINSDESTDIKVGDLVSSETHIFCNRCYQCKINNRHVCENMELFGIGGKYGGFADYAVIPVRTSWKNSVDIPPNVITAQEPLGNAVHVVTKANVTGKTVAVFGLGPVGLCAVSVAKAYGASKVIGINRGEYRRKMAEEMGADEVYDVLPDEYKGKCDVVLEMTGNVEVMVNMLDAVRIAGTVVFFGVPKMEASMDIGKYFINKELRAESVFGRRIWETWFQTAELLRSGKVDLSKLVTHEFKLSEFEKAMEVMKSGESGKVVLIP
jgi:threonine 3-dehydrogenase